jgi:putative flippase GtrA
MESAVNFLSYHLNPLPVINELLRIFPDAIIWGVGFFSIVTISFPFGVFFISLLESLAIFYGIQTLNTYLGVFSEYPSKESYKTSCRTGFLDVTMRTLSIFGMNTHLAFPSPPIYIISVAVSYLLSMLITFKNDLQTLGSAYTSRLYLSAFGLSAIIFLIMSYRLWAGCDSFIIIIMSLITGLLIGALLLQQNRLLLGNSSINMIGIPLLYNTTVNGSPIYICNQPDALGA